jgi:hypothetical protein
LKSRLINNERRIGWGAQLSGDSAGEMPAFIEIVNGPEAEWNIVLDLSGHEI